jgi:ABC-type lipoprotein release transport system permease subunit
VPPAIVNLGRVRSIPVVLAGILAVLALLTVGQVMLTSTRAERRGLAILRSLGATARWIGRAVHWQATLFTVFCLAWGVPTGIVIGRLVFGAFARNLGTVDDAAIPWSLAAVGIVLIVVLANVATAIPARRARREPPARLLRTE